MLVKQLVDQGNEDERTSSPAQKQNHSSLSKNFESPGGNRDENAITCDRPKGFRGSNIKDRGKNVGRVSPGRRLDGSGGLLFGPIYADGPSGPLTSWESLINRGADNMPGDAWRFDSPFYETFLKVGSIEVQRTPDDAWIFDSPFYESFLVE